MRAGRNPLVQLVSGHYFFFLLPLLQCRFLSISEVSKNWGSEVVAEHAVKRLEPPPNFFQEQSRDVRKGFPGALNTSVAAAS